jgi:hypothetical protein
MLAAHYAVRGKREWAIVWLWEALHGSPVLAAVAGGSRGARIGGLPPVLEAATGTFCAAYRIETARDRRQISLTTA